VQLEEAINTGRGWFTLYL